MHPASISSASSTSKDEVADWQRDIQKSTIWLTELINTDASDTDRLNQILDSETDHVTKLLERQQGLMKVLVESFTATENLGSQTPQDLPEQQQELLRLLTMSFTLTTKLGDDALRDIKSKEATMAITEIEEKERTDALKHSDPVSGTLYDSERRLLQYDSDPEQHVTEDLVGMYADPSEVPPKQLDNKLAAHSSLLFNRAKDVQDVLDHFKERMSPEMKDQVHKLEMAMEWMRDYDHMDAGEAERIVRDGFILRTEAMDD